MNTVACTNTIGNLEKWNDNKKKEQGNMRPEVYFVSEFHRPLKLEIKRVDLFIAHKI